MSCSIECFKTITDVLFVFITIGLLVLGAFTIKKKTFVNLDSWEIAQELASNATELAMENGTSVREFPTIF